MNNTNSWFYKLGREVLIEDGMVKESIVNEDSNNSNVYVTVQDEIRAKILSKMDEFKETGVSKGVLTDFLYNDPKYRDHVKEVYNQLISEGTLANFKTPVSYEYTGFYSKDCYAEDKSKLLSKVEDDLYIKYLPEVRQLISSGNFKGSSNDLSNVVFKKARCSSIIRRIINTLDKEGSIKYDRVKDFICSK